MAALLVCANFCVFLVEFFHTAREGDFALLAGVKGMACSAGFNTHFRLCGAGWKLIATSASDGDNVHFWMNIRLHVGTSGNRPQTKIACGLFIQENNPTPEKQIGQAV
jgi:hypothetical protein